LSAIHPWNLIRRGGPIGVSVARPLAIGLTVLALGLLTSIVPAAAAAEVGNWERDGLVGLKVRSLAFTEDFSRLIALTLGATESGPLWVRTEDGWSQPNTTLPNAILSAISLPEGGFLLGTGRDISEQPGIFWLGGLPLTARQLYRTQAIGALAVLPGEPTGQVYAAAAPYGDREASAHLLRWDRGTDTWPVVLEGTLFCGDLPSYFKQIVASTDGRSLLAIEECFTSVSQPMQVWRSDDQGRTWQVLPRSAVEQPRIAVIALEPSDANTVYAVAISPFGHPSAGLERSLDGGKSWAPIGQAIPGLSASRVITPDRRSPGRLFAAGEQAGVFTSDDYGETWQPLAGLEQLRIWSLNLDYASNSLLAGTSDGVWRTSLP
jgi:hypothetical protein